MPENSDCSVLYRFADRRRAGNKGVPRTRGGLVSFTGPPLVRRRSGLARPGRQPTPRPGRAPVGGTQADAPLPHSPTFPTPGRLRTGVNLTPLSSPRRACGLLGRGIRPRPSSSAPGTEKRAAVPTCFPSLPVLGRSVGETGQRNACWMLQARDNQEDRPGTVAGQGPYGRSRLIREVVTGCDCLARQQGDFGFVTGPNGECLA